MKIKTVEKKIQIYTSTVSANKTDRESGMPLFKWEVGLKAVDDDGITHVQMPFISCVEFLLHETFEKPRRFIQKAPFSIIEIGWGGFDLNISLYFTDPSQKPISLTHDLNFDNFKYQVGHTLTFNNVTGSFLQLLKQPIAHGSAKNSSKVSRESTQRRPIASSSKKSRGNADSNWDQDSPPSKKNSSINSRQSPLNRKITKPYSRNYISDVPSSPSSVFSQNSPIPPPSYSRNINKTFNSSKERHSRQTPTWISHGALANKLKQLQGDDIWEAVSMIQSRKSADSFVEDDIQGQFTFDVYSLDEDLLHDLWVFVNDSLASENSSVTSSI